MLGWCYLTVFAAFAIVLKGKNYYLAPIYPMLFAAGAMVIERGIERSRQPWLKPALLAVITVTGLYFAPIVVPVLPVERFITYMNHLPFTIPRSEHYHERAVLPQHYADQFGWIEIVEKVDQAWQRIPAAERADCGILTHNYGEAGAIDFSDRAMACRPH